MSQEVNPEKSWKEIADLLSHEADADRIVDLSKELIKQLDEEKKKTALKKENDESESTTA